MARPAPATAGAKRINVTLFHCHFDAHFTHWTCYLGPHRPDH